MSRHQSDLAWEQFGRRDAYYGVLSDERFRQAHQEGEVRDEFFASGEAHVDAVLTAIRTYVDPTFSARSALDFGCGVGRLVLPLARRIPRVVGMDVSEAMLQEARRNCAEAGVRNVTFVHSDDQLSALDGRFDLIHSVLVFQHIPVRRGEEIAKRLIDRLEEHGVAALHVTYGDSQPPVRRLAQWARSSIPGVHQAINVWRNRRIDYPRAEMHRYQVDRFLDVLGEGGCQQFHLRLTSHGGYRGMLILTQRISGP